jgi:deoxyribose-phosphate aldolase
MVPLEFVRKIDHLLTEPQVSRAEVEAGCQIAVRCDCYAVVVKPHYVEFARKLLKDTSVKIIAVVGFPHGGASTATKMFETQDVLQRGADEVEMVINIGALRDREDLVVKNDIMSVVNVARGHPITVVLETCYLNDEEKTRACTIADAAKATAVETSSDFCLPGASGSEIQFLRAALKNMPVIAAGGIATSQAAREMLQAGAARVASRQTEAIVNEVR